MGKVQAYTLWDLIALHLSLFPRLAIAGDSHRNVSIPKHLKKLQGSVCMCVLFMWTVCVFAGLQAYFWVCIKPEPLRVRVCVGWYRSGFSSIIGYRRRQQSQCTMPHDSLSTHTCRHIHTRKHSRYVGSTRWDILMKTTWNTLDCKGIQWCLEFQRVF